MIEEALRAPTSVGMLKIDGGVLIKELESSPDHEWAGYFMHYSTKRSKIRTRTKLNI